MAIERPARARSDEIHAAVDAIKRRLDILLPPDPTVEDLDRAERIVRSVAEDVEEVAPYALRLLPPEEARHVLDAREGVVARQVDTDAFLAFLAAQPAADDPDPRHDADA